MPYQDNSPQLARNFPNLIPLKPYCADVLAHGLLIRNRSVALTMRHIQLNGPSSFRWMCHDIDRSDAYYAHRDAVLPAPNVVMINPQNGHAHAAYLLATPVARHSFARLAPLALYAACERGIARRIDADRRYAGLIAKNPLHADWKVEWRRDQPYTLGDLESSLFKDDMRPETFSTESVGAGRNVTVFEELRVEAYREVLWYKNDGLGLHVWLSRCTEIALAINARFVLPLSPREVGAIARSVGRWTWKHFNAEKFSAIQSHRSKLKWAGHAAESTLRPWLKLGISRRTYYRRKKAKLAE